MAYNPTKSWPGQFWVTKESALTTLGKYGSISYAQYLPERGRIAATHVHKTS
jgi:hypothetical protein